MSGIYDEVSAQVRLIDQVRKRLSDDVMQAKDRATKADKQFEVAARAREEARADLDMIVAALNAVEPEAKNRPTQWDDER